jgi:hypothetical protein
MVLGEQPTGPWKDADRKLLRALQILEDETCGHCGNPVWLCHSEDSNLLWEVRTQVCYAQKEVQSWSEKNKDSRDLPYAVPYVLKYDDNGRPVHDYENLPGRRDFFSEVEA